MQYLWRAEATRGILRVQARELRKRELSANRRAAMRAQDKMPKGYWNLLLAFYGSQCLSCGSTEGLSHDHVVPVSQGGAHSLRNAQVLCGRCDSAKRNWHSTDYRNYGRGILAGMAFDEPMILSRPRTLKLFEKVEENGLKLA